MNPASIGRPEGAPARIVPVRLPADPVRVFARRAARFRELAPMHAAGDYLLAMASLAEAQVRACGAVRAPSGGRRLRPDDPPLGGAGHRGEAWRAALEVILGEMEKATLPGPAHAAVERLGAGVPAVADTLADRLLAGAFEGIDLAASPFVGAALQVYWTTEAAALPPEALAQEPHGCPVCDAPPVAATVLGGDGLRYLTCSLCAADWHRTRVVCTNCGSAEGLSYFTIQGGPGAVKAEACGQCRTYLKLCYLEQEPRAEPFADDVATLPLDLLMAEEGYARRGVNLFLLSGA